MFDQVLSRKDEVKTLKDFVKKYSHYSGMGNNGIFFFLSFYQYDGLRMYYADPLLLNKRSNIK
ncbi:hypothetical protein DERP_015033 [Dermatophagoides pteronyssinus]|uniref:Uncharacterized protein n=1 Tax=Dermatophagoides pteronyssinus TaxID=6956 RepID=A0ABQ8JDE8_DERPT|nr:hypothetical protein DERP_015033 [Dermatophagoides pteronyssinus]